MLNSNSFHDMFVFFTQSNNRLLKFSLQHLYWWKNCEEKSSFALEKNTLYLWLNKKISMVLHVNTLFIDVLNLPSKFGPKSQEQTAYNSLTKWLFPLTPSYALIYSPLIETACTLLQKYILDLKLFQLFYFLLPISRESIVFWVKFLKWRFWWIYTFWGPLNPKITFLANGLCVCVCVCVCYQHDSETNYSRNTKFGIQHLYLIQMLLETFYEARTKTLSTGALKKF